MANHASALKRNRQNRRRKLINQINRQKLKTQLKKLKTAIAGGNAQAARQMIPKTFGLIDRSVQKGVIRANTARRYKSRMHRHVNSLPA